VSVVAETNEDVTSPSPLRQYDIEQSAETASRRTAAAAESGDEQGSSTRCTSTVGPPILRFLAWTLTSERLLLISSRFM
jgi:hypothetical protein